MTTKTTTLDFHEGTAPQVRLFGFLAYQESASDVLLHELVREDGGPAGRGRGVVSVPVLDVIGLATWQDEQAQDFGEEGFHRERPSA